MNYSMASSKIIVQQIYHEKESINASKSQLMKNGVDGQYLVCCSKALLNCLLQREMFKENVYLNINPVEIPLMNERLNLKEYFKSFPGNSSNLLGSILAMSKALSPLNISLTPVENITYTSLVEKRKAFVCLIDSAWIIFRHILGQWYFIDPRSTAKAVTDTYLHMVIKQLLLDKAPIYGISGGEFSDMKVTLSCNQITHATPGTSSNNSDSNQKPIRMILEPKPPDLNIHYVTPRHNSHKERVDETVRMLSDFSRLCINIASPGRIFNRNVNRERCRSETRTEDPGNSCATSSPQRSSRINYQVYDAEFPPLASTREKISRRRRARSSPRLNPWKQQLEITPEIKIPSKEEGKKQPSKKTKDSTNESLCCICLVGNPDYALYPCGHQCLCISCKTSFLQKFKQCPICKDTVTDAIRIYRT